MYYFVSLPFLHSCLCHPIHVLHAHRCTHAACDSACTTVRCNVMDDLKDNVWLLQHRIQSTMKPPIVYLLHTKTPIYTGTETDTHAHCIPGRVAGRNDLSYIVNSGKTHCKWQCYKLNWVCTPKTIVYKLWIINLQHLYPFYNNTEHH